MSPSPSPELRAAVHNDRTSEGFSSVHFRFTTRTKAGGGSGSGSDEPAARVTPASYWTYAVHENIRELIGYVSRRRATPTTGVRWTATLHHHIAPCATDVPTRDEAAHALLYAYLEIENTTTTITKDTNS